MKFILCLLSSVFCLLTSGCAEIEVPTPKDVMTHPFGKQQTMRGWTKEEVKIKWGEPDQIVALEPDQWSGTREEWVYYGRYPSVPIDYKYLSKTHHFYFSGNALVEFMTEEGETEKTEAPGKEK